MENNFVLTAIIILIALTFDFINGFHDAANSIATVVSTRVLTPLKAVAWAAVWNFAAAFLLGIVTHTVEGGSSEVGPSPSHRERGGFARAVGVAPVDRAPA